MPTVLGLLRLGPAGGGIQSDVVGRFRWLVVLSTTMPSAVLALTVAPSRITGGVVSAEAAVVKVAFFSTGPLPVASVTLTTTIWSVYTLKPVIWPCFVTIMTKHGYSADLLLLYDWHNGQVIGHV